MTLIAAYGWEELNESASTPLNAFLPTGGWRSAFASTLMTLRDAIEPKWSATIELASSCSQEATVEYAAGRYDSVSAMIRAFADMDSDESLSIDQEASEAGEMFMSVARSYNIPPPKIFAHGGDALVFTWELGNKTRCLTTSSCNVYLQEFEPNGLGGETKTFDLRKSGDVFNLTRITGGEAWKQVRIQDRSLTKIMQEV